MSIRSRNRADRNQKAHPSSDPLFSQKQAIKSAMLGHLGAAVLFFGFAIAVIMIALLNERVFSNTSGIILAELILGVIFVFYLASFLRRFAIFRQFRKIMFSREQTVFVYCKKISFLLQPLSKFSSTILCITWIDENGNKFRYVYPEQSAPSDFSQKYMKEKYIGNKVE
ncbi:MAG: hypothetical protein IJZ28_03590, partial [Clostridia bacterium]|nr:hypothetical protein [Clostridia bacterium]